MNQEEGIYVLKVDPNAIVNSSTRYTLNADNCSSNFKSEQNKKDSSSHCSIFDLLAAETELNGDKTGDVDDLERRRIEEEINTTLRSLKTNFILTSAFLVTFLGLFLLPVFISVVVISVMKGMIPLLTSITNFGKIKNLFDKYKADVAQKLKFL